MIKNLEVNNSSKIKISKPFIHKIIGLLKNEFSLAISSLQINFVTSDQIVKINNEFLNHNYSTDIITFSYSKNKEIIESEIYISADDALKNGQKFGVSFANEVLRLVIHGILHLIGYDDNNKINKQKMKKIENQLVKKYSEIFLRN